MDFGLKYDNHFTAIHFLFRCFPLFDLPEIEKEEKTAVDKIALTPHLRKKFVKAYCETFYSLIDWKKQALNIAKRNITAAEIDLM